MSELESDIREAHHAISDAMRSDERVDALLPRCSRLAYSPAAAAGATAAAGGAENEPPSTRAFSPSLPPSPPSPPSRSVGGDGATNGEKFGETYAHADEGGENEEGEEEPEPPDLARRAAVVGLLQTHLWRIRAAGGQLSELSQQVEATREVWELFLDGVRNRTVRRGP